MYQAAMGVPTRILVVFFIALPQVLFYSSGYKVLTPSWSNHSHDNDQSNTTTTFLRSLADGNGSDDSGDDMYVDDDLISNKYSWTAISFFEILITRIFAAVLAYWSYRVIKCVSNQTAVVAQIDAAYEAITPQDNQEEQRRSRCKKEVVIGFIADS